MGPQHPDVTVSLGTLGVLYAIQDRDEEAERLYTRSLEIWEKTLGPDHPDVAIGLENYAKLLRKTGRFAEAEELETRAASIRTDQEQ